MIKKILMVATGVFLAALLSSCGIKSHSVNDNNNSNQQAESKNKPEFLFILSAKEGKITKLGDNQYKLVIKKSNFHESVIAFSDRPYRIVKQLSMPQFISLWDKGENSFKDDPPNASLNATHLEPLVIEMIKRPINNVRDNTYEIIFKVLGVREVPVGLTDDIAVTVDKQCLTSQGPVVGGNLFVF